ncbi:MAG: DUF4340 domain-containing protein, partial [Chloroflexota bacterium]
RNIIVGVVLIAVIAGLIIYGNQTSTDIDATPTVDTETVTGALLPDVDSTTINEFAIRELPQTPPEDATEEPTALPSPTPVTTEEPLDSLATDGEPRTIMRKNADGFWVITEATNATDRGVDQVTAQGTVDIVASLDFADQFAISESGADLAAFGLEEPLYQITLANSTETFNVLLGEKNPAGTRYYVQLDGDADTVYLVVSDILDNVVGYIENPPYVPPPTPTPTATATPNPFSEVEQTQTAQAIFDATSTAVAIPTEDDSVGPALPDGVTEDAEMAETEEMTTDATEDAEMVATEDMTAEATEDAEMVATEDMTTDATEDAEMVATEDMTTDATE